MSTLAEPTSEPTSEPMIEPTVEPELAHDDHPYVCPGCYAVGGEPCLPGCIDEDIRQATYERLEDDEPEDDEPDWGLDENAFFGALLGAAPGTCTVGDMTFTAVHPPTHREVAELLFSPRPWSDEVLCAGCNEWHALSIVAPPEAVQKDLMSSASVTCACGITISVAYSWRRGAVVGLRYQRPGEALGEQLWPTGDASEETLMPAPKEAP